MLCNWCTRHCVLYSMLMVAENGTSALYVGVSKIFETSSVERQLMAVCECVRRAWEQGTSPLSMPSGVAV